MIGALLSTLFVGINYQSANADPPEPWEVTGVSPQDLRVHGDGSVTVTNCSDYVTQTNSSTDYAAVTYDPSGSVISEVPKQAAGIYGPWTSSSCRYNSVAGLDGSFFVKQTDNWGSTRIAAYKNNALRWTYEVKRCSQPARVSDIELGSNGSLYMVVDRLSWYTCGSTTSELISLDVHDGSEVFRTPYSVSELGHDQWLFALGDELVVKTRREILVFDNDGDARSSETIAAPVDYEIGNAFGYDDADSFVYLMHSTSSVTPPTACSSFGADIRLFHKTGTATPSELTLDDCEDISDIEIKPNGKLVYVYLGYGSANGWRLKQRSTSGTVDFDVSLSDLSGYTVSTADIYTIDTLTVSAAGGIYVKRQVTASPSGSLTDTDIRVDSFDSSGIATTVFDTSDLDDSGVKEVRAKMRTLGVAIADDSLFVPYCMDSCDATSTGYVVQANASVGFDFPRSSAITAHPQLNYVALGDSFSSGEGVEPFISGTDTSTNGCHRSEEAYAMRLDEDSSVDWNLRNFRACSGADTDGVIHGHSGETGQLDSFTSDTDIVTLTVGGNDIGFLPFVKACLNPLLVDGCTASSQEYQDAFDVLDDGILTDRLTSEVTDEEGVLTLIKRLAPDAQVYVIGYPQVLPSTDDYEVSWCGPIDETERIGGRTLVSSLNTVIKEATDSMGSNFHYVDPEASGSPFLGHELCKDDSYFNGLTGTPNVEYSLHPNASGQGAYYNLILNVI